MTTNIHPQKYKKNKKLQIFGEKIEITSAELYKSQGSKKTYTSGSIYLSNGWRILIRKNNFTLQKGLKINGKITPNTKLYQRIKRIIFNRFRPYRAYGTFLDKREFKNITTERVKQIIQFPLKKSA